MALLGPHPGLRASPGPRCFTWHLTTAFSCLWYTPTPAQPQRPNCARGWDRDTLGEVMLPGHPCTPWTHPRRCSSLRRSCSHGPEPPFSVPVFPQVIWGWQELGPSSTPHGQEILRRDAVNPACSTGRVQGPIAGGGGRRWGCLRPPAATAGCLLRMCSCSTLPAAAPPACCCAGACG